MSLTKNHKIILFMEGGGLQSTQKNEDRMKKIATLV